MWSTPFQNAAFEITADLRNESPTMACLDCDAIYAFPHGRYTTHQVTSSSLPSVLPLHEASAFSWVLVPGGPACFAAELSKELALKRTSVLCFTCTHGRICSSLQPCKPFNTWAVKPDDPSLGFRCHYGLILAPGRSPLKFSLPRTKTPP